MTAKQMLQKMPEAVNPEAARETEATIQYEISEPTYQVLKDGRLTVHEGRAEAPDLTVTMADDDLVRLFRGELDPMMAYMTGQLKVSGDVNLAQRLAGLVDRDKVGQLT